MRIARWLLLAASLSSSLSVVAADDLMASAQARFKPVPQSPPSLPGNPATPAKVELGKMLYFDPRLSASHAISCNSCHNVGLGGVDAEETSIGHHWQRGGRNAPTMADGIGVKSAEEATRLQIKSMKRVGQELYIVYRVRSKS